MKYSSVVPNLIHINIKCNLWRIFIMTSKSSSETICISFKEDLISFAQNCTEMGCCTDTICQKLCPFLKFLLRTLRSGKNGNYSNIYLKAGAKTEKLDRTWFFDTRATVDSASLRGWKARYDYIFIKRNASITLQRLSSNKAFRRDWSGCSDALLWES